MSGRRGLAPLLPTYIPNEAGGVKVDPLSVRYALGPAGYGTMQGILPPDAVVWSKSAEAATASYSGRGGKGTLTLLLFPTSQVAETKDGRSRRSSTTSWRRLQAASAR